nr:MFS transporter [Clostridia bacterium]
MKDTQISLERSQRIAESGTDAEVRKELERLVNVDRRAVARKETIGYMLFESNNDFNINGHKSLFVDSILNIKYELQSTFNFIAGIWDIVDDFLLGAFIERTRTRWGKFIPHLFLTGLPAAALSTLYWLLPIMFSQEHINQEAYLPKFFAWMILEMVTEAFSTIKSISVSGYLSTITPYPSDRRRLIARSKYFAMIYSRLPDMVIEFMLDFITNDIIFKDRDSWTMIRNSLMIVGPMTAIVSAIFITWYSTIAKERVQQSVEKPNIKN